MLYMASRRRRRFLVGFPGIFAFLFALIGYSAMRDDTLETQGDWKIIFPIACALTLLSVVLVIGTPERTKKRRQLDELQPVPSTLHSWFLERRKQGKASIPYYLAIVGSEEHIYLNEVQGGLLKVIQEAHNEQKLIVMMEEGFSKGLVKTLKKYAHSDIQKIESSEGALCLTLTSSETTSFYLTNQVDPFEVGMATANAVMPGVAGTRQIDEVEQGMVRKKMVTKETLIFERANAHS